MICFRPSQDDHGLGKWRPDLEDRSVLFPEVGKEGRNVAVANVGIKQQFSQRDGRNLL